MEEAKWKRVNVKGAIYMENGRGEMEQVRGKMQKKKWNGIREMELEKNGKGVGPIRKDEMEEVKSRRANGRGEMKEGK